LGKNRIKKGEVLKKREVRWGINGRRGGRGYLEWNTEMSMMNGLVHLENKVRKNWEEAKAPRSSTWGGGGEKIGTGKKTLRAKATGEVTHKTTDASVYREKAGVGVVQYAISKVGG